MMVKNAVRFLEANRNNTKEKQLGVAPRGTHGWMFQLEYGVIREHDLFYS